MKTLISKKTSLCHQHTLKLNLRKWEVRNVGNIESEFRKRKSY